MSNRFADSSIVVAAVRRLASGSVCCAAVASGLAAVRRVEGRIAVGLRGNWVSQAQTSRDFRTAADGSRAAAWLFRALDAPRAAAPDARSGQWLRKQLMAPAGELVRAAGLLLATAVATHAIVFGLSGIDVRSADWVVRAGLVGVALIAILAPDAVITSWTQRRRGRRRAS